MTRPILALRPSYGPSVVESGACGATTSETITNPSERRYAERLDGLCIPWIHQPRRFRFAHCSYLPDFYLPIQDTFVEIIGTRQRWHQLKPKLALFRLHFPDTRIQVLDGEGKPWGLRPRRGKEDRPAHWSRVERIRRNSASAKAARAAWRSAPPLLCEYMSRSGRKQSDLAASVGVRQGTISRILNGHRTPSLKLALLLAREASVPVESLYTAGQE